MKLPTRKSQIAIAITVAIGFAGLSSCSTHDSKVTQLEEDKDVEKVEATKLKSDVHKTIETEQLVVARTPPPHSSKEAMVTGSRLRDESRAKQRGQKQQFASTYLPAVNRNLTIAKPEVVDRENYAHLNENGISLVAETPVSTFSIDVDTGAYTNTRRILNQGQLPPKDAVRTEEFINYFSYDYEAPTDSDTPFAVHSDMMKSPWAKDSYLLQVGVQAWEPINDERPDANLVFLVDVSGSMTSENKLGLLKKSLALLTKKLTSKDRISIVVYAGASGVVLEPIAGNQTAQIELALDSLKAGDSTNGASGIKLAYQMAEKSFIKGGINRILLATDGDFNVGTTNFNSLMDLVEEKRKSGIALSTLGFGSGNYNDHLMEQLADKGNGQYSYIDSLMEAKKVLVDEMNSSLLTVASDVKIQLEFNPQVVSEYRLIGYENRALAREDFNNDKVDAGDIGAGHTVTAIYEVRFIDSNNRAVDSLRYGNKEDRSSGLITSQHKIDELGYLKLRYKNTGEQTSNLIKQVLSKKQLLNKAKQPSKSMRFAAAVAGFAQQLRGGKYLENFSYPKIASLAQSSKGEDKRGIRGEFIQLVSLAELLSQKDKG
ncbi:MAG: Ca-activated chloride channel family protein [Enterobacterales bacterium]|jgi:Ca-activated chloride channel family protein